VSLLWPETVIAGLFPGHCWLQRGGVLSRHAGSFTSGEQLLGALEALFDAQERPLGKGARVHVQVSDSVALVLPLPWQDLLNTPDELRTYAQARFEKRGTPVDGSWVLQTGFRRFCSTGIAYALRRAWLEQLMATLEARQLRLVTVLPVSAAAYWRHSGTAGRSVVLLGEPRRLTAMSWQGRQLLDVDVQPVAGLQAEATARLLLRIGATHGAMAHVAQWQAVEDSAGTSADGVAASFPDAVIDVLPLLAWR
jgi:hypothetical protein